MPSRGTRPPRGLITCRDRLTGQRTALPGRIRARGRQPGILVPPGHRAWTDHGRSLIATFGNPLADCGPTELGRGELTIDLADLNHVMEQIAGGESTKLTCGRGTIA